FSLQASGLRAHSRRLLRRRKESVRMSVNPLQTTSPIEQLARSLVDRFDVNRDGQLTTEEFTSVLSSFAERARSAAAAAANDEGSRPKELPAGLAEGRAALEPLLAGNLSDPALQNA